MRGSTEGVCIAIGSTGCHSIALFPPLCSVSVYAVDVVPNFWGSCDSAERVSHIQTDWESKRAFPTWIASGLDL